MEQKAKTLIVSGLGALDEYLAAAAIALRAYPDAEVAFASRQALPAVLSERAANGFGLVLLLGVGLTADPAPLGDALEAMRNTGARIVWISLANYQVPDSLPPEIRLFFEAREVEADSLPKAVAATLGASADDLATPFAPARTQEAKAWGGTAGRSGVEFCQQPRF